jgi:3-hydroxybutyryl-CoA dehydrogenase
MGRGIAQVTATGGMQVLMADSRAGAAQEARDFIEKMLERAAEKGTMTKDEAVGAVNRIHIVGGPADMQSCHVVVEAIVENLQAKQELFGQLESVVAPECILATNTSSLSVTTIASRMKTPQRFAGLHFFNPVPLMKLVEVVRTILTDEAAAKAATEWVRAVGKVPVQAKDATAFIVNRLLVPYLLDAIRVYEGGLASLEDIDQAMKLGCGYPMGPFTLLDLVGLDTTMYVAEVMFDEFREARYAPPPLLKRMVMAGQLGRKTGKGFYSYGG